VYPFVLLIATLKLDSKAIMFILEERLSKVPDPVEFAKVQVHFEGLQKLLEEKDERIKNLNREVEGLQKEVERLDMFAHYFKSVEVKQIEAPAAEKTKPWWRFW
jgi:archaellum component FlaC